jgi:hypothetical protein
MVRGLLSEGARASEVLGGAEFAGRGDLDRLLTEWRSLLKQLAAAPALTLANGGSRSADVGGTKTEGGERTAQGGSGQAAETQLRSAAAGSARGSAGRSNGSDRANGAGQSLAVARAAAMLRTRWDELRAAAQQQLARLPRGTLPELPPLSAEQRRPISHRLGQVTATGSQPRSSGSSAVGAKGAFY